ncbi:transmembrane 4 L6 family member 1 [Pogona vitticeps]
MCYGRCAKYIGYILLVLAVLCIVVNVLLYFPNGERSHVHLNTYVGCLHGIIGGGILVMIPACVFIGLEHQHFHDCCPRENHRRNCALLASVCLACIGLLGAGYCFIISALGIANEPHCFPVDDKTGCHHSLDSARGYHNDHPELCPCPEYTNNAATWNICLFCISLILSGIEAILCAIHIINGCIGGAWAVCHSDTEVSAYKQLSKLSKSRLFDVKQNTS